MLRQRWVSVCRLLNLLSIFVHTSNASLQGMYSLSEGGGQLRRVDWLNGSAVDIGKPLSESGYSVPSCAATIVQQTNKWYFTIAKNTTTNALDLVGINLGDGSVQYWQPLPNLFPASLGSCDFTIDVDGGLVLFVTAVVPGHSLEARLMTVRFGHKPRMLEPSADTTVVLNVSLSSIDLGNSVAYPSSTMMPSGDLWYQLQEGVVGFNVVTAKLVAKVRLPRGIARFAGLFYSQSSLRVHGVAMDKTSSPQAIRGFSVSMETSRLASFDPTDMQPELQVGNESFAGVSRDGTSAALFSDKMQFAVICGSDLLILDLDSGRTLSSLTHYCAASCPSSIGYLPYVFDDVL